MSESNHDGVKIHQPAEIAAQAGGITIKTLSALDSQSRIGDDHSRIFSAVAQRRPTAASLGDDRRPVRIAPCAAA